MRMVKIGSCAEYQMPHDVYLSWHMQNLECKLALSLHAFSLICWTLIEGVRR
jgi:hypothetical protein